MPAQALIDAAAERAVIRAPVVRAAARHGAGVVVLALVYLGSAEIGYVLDFAGPVAAVVWLPAGVGIAFLYLAGLRFWPGVVVGDLLANDYGALPLGSALGQTVGNLLEVVAATVLLRRLVRDASPLGSASALVRMLIALAAGTAVSATVGAVSLRLGDVIAAGEVPKIWRTWWLGDFSGALVVVPLAIAWFRPAASDAWKGRRLEAAAMLLAVVALTSIAFSNDGALTYIVFPALIWAALRFGQRGTTLAVALAVALTVYDTTHFDGPFAFDSLTRSVLTTQLYIAVAAVSTLCLAAVVSEREGFARRLGASRVRLIRAGDTARRRLEHDLHDGAQQRLTAIAMHLRAAAADVRDDPARATALFEAASAELSVAIDELRQLARGLHPAVLTERGLGHAIREVAERSPVPITVVDVPAGRVRDTAEATAYFVFAEAVANAQKHAGAASIRVRARVAGGTLDVEVADDGVGGAAESAGSGLEGLRDRVEATGGTFTLDSPPERGTRVRATIPLSAGS